MQGKWTSDEWPLHMYGWVSVCIANLHLVVWVFCIHWIRVVWLWLPVLTGFAFSQIPSRIMLLIIIMLWFLYCRRSEVCSHVAAVLFKAEEACRLGYNKPTCTSLQCSWNQSFSTKVPNNHVILFMLFLQVDPALVVDINFIKPNHNKSIDLTTSTPTVRWTQVVQQHDVNTDSLYHTLYQILPGAYIFTIRASNSHT